MFDTRGAFNAITGITDTFEGINTHRLLLNQAIALFNKAYWNGRKYRLRMRLFGRNFRMRSLEHTKVDLSGSSYAGIRLVTLKEICGSESRSNDFDDHFYPTTTRLRQRWLNIAIARLQYIFLPPVELIQWQGHYYVRDGHHRISVARMTGQEEMEAAITIWRGPNS